MVKKTQKEITCPILSNILNMKNVESIVFLFKLIVELHGMISHLRKYIDEFDLLQEIQD